MTKAIYFDMDGTIANLYGVENWLDYLMAEDETPYAIAKPLLNMQVLARKLNKMRADGWIIGVISWLSKTATEEYSERITKAKTDWLNKHLHSVQFDEIHIVEYGTPKQTVCDFPQGILFDDEERNRDNWIGDAFDVTNIIEVLREVA